MVGIIGVGLIEAQLSIVRLEREVDMADRGCAAGAGVLERCGAELEPVEKLLGRYRRFEPGRV